MSSDNSNSSRKPAHPGVGKSPSLQAPQVPDGGDPFRLPTEEEKRIWIGAWQTAAVALDRIRQEELLALDGQALPGRTSGLEASSGSARDLEIGERNGLVVLQAWFTRFRLLQVEQKYPGASKSNAG